MKLRKIGNNTTEIVFGNGESILFSYNTPVAAFSNNRGWLRTNKYHSRTTTRHLNDWLPPEAQITEVPQHDLDTLSSIGGQ